MKKSFVIVLEIIIILCLLLTLFGKVFKKQSESSLELISTKIGSTVILAKKANSNHKADFLWNQAIVGLSSEPETRESFWSQRTTLLKQENKLSELNRLSNKGTPIKTTSTNFLWTDVKVNPYGDSATKETFSAKRTALLNQEKR